MSESGIAGTVIFILIGIGGIIFLYMFPSVPNHTLLPASVAFIFIGGIIGIVDSYMKK